MSPKIAVIPRYVLMYGRHLWKMSSAAPLLGIMAISSINAATAAAIGVATDVPVFDFSVLLDPGSHFHADSTFSPSMASCFPALAGGFKSNGNPFPFAALMHITSGKRAGKVICCLRPLFDAAAKTSLLRWVASCKAFNIAHLGL